MKKKNGIKLSDEGKPEFNQDLPQNCHLEGLTQDEINMVELIAEIIVKAVVKNKKNQYLRK